MRMLRVFSCLLLLATFASAQQGAWTIYYSDTDTANADGSVTITPTVSISGDDDGYCNIWSGFSGYEQPGVMLNGNAWQWQVAQGSGGANYGGYPVSWAYTFPNVTVQPGAVTDMSFAGKIQGLCNFRAGLNMPGMYLTHFYLGQFVDGVAPGYSPGPCWLLNPNSPACPVPWPYIYTASLVGWHAADLDSQQVAFSIGAGYTTQWFSHIYDPLGKANVYTSMQPCSALCTGSTLVDVPGPYWSYLSNIQDWISYNGPPKADKSNVFCIPLATAQKPGQNQVPPRPFCYDTTLP